jgi:hypothetical protein
VELALAHVEPDWVPLDLGGSAVTGMHVDSVYRLRQALGLDAPGTPVKVVEPYQMLGEIAPDLVDALGVDVIGVGLPTTFFGFENEGWKPWTTFGGTPVLVSGAFTTDPDDRGDILMYPEGDTSVPASGRLPNGGFYFDAIVRQQPLDEEKLDPADNLEEFQPISAAHLAHMVREVERAAASGKAVLLNLGDTGFGDIAFVPGTKLKQPRGIRDIEEWYVSLQLRREYVHEIFERQCELGLQNLKTVHDAVGDAVTVAYITGTDFGAQQGPFISPKLYRDLFKPFHVRVNAWIHEHTSWKTFIHSCGSIWQLLDDIVDAGFDILNPVQTSAAEMDPIALKKTYGDRVTFWGGGIDTQQVLPFGTPEDVREMVKERIRIFGQGGGFVFNTVHNVQARIPVENILALYETVRDHRVYPLD